MLNLEKITEYPKHSRVKQHPTYTEKIETENNSVMFDVRMANDYLNRFVLKYRIMKPNTAKMQFNSIQKDKLFNSRAEAREFIMNEIVTNL